MKLTLKDANILLNIVWELWQIEWFQTLINMSMNEKKMNKFMTKHTTEIQAMNIWWHISNIVAKHKRILDNKSFIKILSNLENYNLFDFVDKFTYKLDSKWNFVLDKEWNKIEIFNIIKENLAKEIKNNINKIYKEVKDTPEFKEYFWNILEISNMKSLEDDSIEHKVNIYRLELTNKAILKDIESNNKELYDNIILYQSSYEYLVNEWAMNTLASQKFTEDYIGKSLKIEPTK